MSAYLVPLSKVITLEISYLVCFIVQCQILRYELQKRSQLDSNVSTTKFSKWCSILSIISGVLYGLMGCARFLNYTCYVAGTLIITSVCFQGIFLGLYQLHRLFYCFAQKMVHSTHGYPLLVFVFMGSCGICLAAYAAIGPWAFLVHGGKCGMDATGTFGDTFNTKNSVYMHVSIGVLCYTLWDIATLLLYVGKVQYVRKHINHQSWRNTGDASKIENRVMSILQRILVLTFLYEIVVCLYAFSIFFGNAVNVYGTRQSETVFYTIQNILAIAGSIAMSLSVFLMQQHNDAEYQKFLEIVGRLKLHFICCFCCLSIIRREMAGHCEVETEEMETEGMKKNTCYTLMEDEPVKMMHSIPTNLSVQRSSSFIHHI